VDRAIAVLAAHGASQACVNAGGDLRLFGPAPETVALATEDPANRPVTVLADGAIASSCGAMAERGSRDGEVHIAARGAAKPRRFVAVMAPACMDADALTKVVMALGEDARPHLAAWGAKAVLHQASTGWREIAGAA
jgi:thiamine biosynthesis lipoprotein